MNRTTPGGTTPAAPAQRERARAIGVVAVVATALALAGGSASAATAPVVGTVATVGGSERLLVRDRPGAATRPLSAGTRLRLGQQVVMGAGVTARIRLVRPRSVSADVDLITLRPATGARHVVRVTRSGSVTTLRIRPVRR